MRRAHVGVAQRHDVGETGGIKRLHVVRAAIADADAREVDLVRRRSAEHQSRNEHRSRTCRQNAFQK